VAFRCSRRGDEKGKEFGRQKGRRLASKGGKKSDTLGAGVRLPLKGDTEIRRRAENSLRGLEKIGKN